MKFIHTADLHLDAPMESNLSPEAARERRAELLNGFSRLLQTGEREGVDGILIAGDLFDSDRVTKRTLSYVLDTVAAHPTLRVFYLAGNHDKGSALHAAEALPENLFLFGDTWTTYSLGDVTVTGAESPDFDTLAIPPERVNLVLLHGQESTGRTAKGDRIPFAKLKKRGIDYLALGHLHEYRTAQLDSRGLACYPGCPEGRGFDECGAKGYVLIDIEGKHLNHRFVPSASRVWHTVACDITGAATQLEVEQRIEAATLGLPAADAVKVRLVGEASADTSFDLRLLSKHFSGRFWFFKLKDESRLSLSVNAYQNDISLKGEFVRRVRGSSLSEEEKARVLSCGLAALRGEEVGS